MIRVKCLYTLCTHSKSQNSVQNTSIHDNRDRLNKLQYKIYFLKKEQQGKKRKLRTNLSTY